MAKMKLTPGTYVTINPVENPQKDRRYRRDWRHREVIPAGMRFEVYDASHGIIDDEERARGITLEMIQPSGGGVAIGPGNDLYHALAPHLASVERTPMEKVREMLAKTGAENIEAHVFVKLLESGKVTEAELEIAMNAAYVAWEAKQK